MSWFALNIYAQERSKEQKYESLSKRNISIDQSVPSLLAEAEDLHESDPSEALDLVKKALATSITQKSTFNEAKCFLMLGKINENLNETELANQNYLEAFNRLGGSYQTTPEYQQVLSGLGRMNFSLSRFEDAKQFYSALLRTPLDEQQIIDTELQLAEIEVALGNSPAALVRVNKLAPSISRKKSKASKSKARAIKARAYAQQENYEAAEESILEISEDESEAASEGAGAELDAFGDDIVLEEVVLADEEASELLNIYQQQNRTEDEIELREKIALKKADANLPLQATQQRQAIGKVLIEQGRTSAAIDQLKQATVLADSTDNATEQANAYAALAKAYKSRGSNRLALEAYESYSRAMQSALDEQKQERSLRESLLKKQQDIAVLTNELALDESSYLLEETTTELQSQQLRAQRSLIYGLLILLVIVVVGTILIYRNAQKTKRVGQLLALKSLRSEMNPHFIFNALNSVNQFVALNDERAANKFLAEFSKLMRMVLDNSQKEFITLREEKEMLTLYLKLEHYRFRDQFDFEFEIDNAIDLDEHEIPPMLIQPHIENAIWHGLRYKESHGHLSVKIVKNGSAVLVKVEDDGIGRAESKRLKTSNQKKKNSVGIKNTQERIRIINEVYDTNYSIEVSNLSTDGSGTKVTINTPLNHG